MTAQVRVSFGANHRSGLPGSFYDCRVSSRGWIACGAGAVVVLEALDAVLINELQRGWPWWVAAGAVVLVAAAVTWWMALRPSRGDGVIVGSGAVKAGTIRGSVETRADVPGDAALPESGDGTVFMPGSVVANRIEGSVRTWVSGGRPPEVKP